MPSHSFIIQLLDNLVELWFIVCFFHTGIVVNSAMVWRIRLCVQMRILSVYISIRKLLWSHSSGLRDIVCFLLRVVYISVTEIFISKCSSHLNLCYISLFWWINLLERWTLVLSTRSVEVLTSFIDLDPTSLLLFLIYER